MRVGRVLRWGRLGFLRRRLPYLVFDVCLGPCRNLWFLAKNPDVAWLSLRVRRAISQGEIIVTA